MSADRKVTLCDLVLPDSILANLRAEDKNGAIRELVGVLATSGRIPADAADGLAKSIITRERTRGTTGFGKGVAVPHGKLEGLSACVAALGRVPGGIDFASLDREPVFGIFLLVSPAEPAAAHLQAMDLVFGHLQQEKFRKFLRQADDREKILDLLREADERRFA